MADEPMTFSGEGRDLPQPKRFTPPEGRPAPFSGSGAEPEPSIPRLSLQVQPARPMQQGNTIPVAGVVSLRSWKGMNSNASPHLLAEHAVAIQVNVNSIVLGQIQGRGGLRAVSFEN